MVHFGSDHIFFSFMKKTWKSVSFESCALYQILQTSKLQVIKWHFQDFLRSSSWERNTEPLAPISSPLKSKYFSICKTFWPTQNDWFSMRTGGLEGRTKRFSAIDTDSTRVHFSGKRLIIGIFYMFRRPPTLWYYLIYFKPLQALSRLEVPGCLVRASIGDWLGFG